MFVEGHPILWAGSIPDALRALECCHRESRDRFDREMSVADAAADLALDRWSEWGEPERVVTLANTCYREFGHDEPATVADLVGPWPNCGDRQRR